jgi:HAD superfamily hydrolase (TIGR01509 family)
MWGHRVIPAVSALAFGSNIRYDTLAFQERGPLHSSKPAEIGMGLPRAPAAVVFDMDGLLFDTEALYLDAFLAASTEGGHGLTTGLFRRMIGGTWVTNRSVLLDHAGLDFPIDAFRAAWHRHYQQIATSGVTLKPGVIALLDTLDALRLPRAIATSSQHHTVRDHLASSALAERFHAIVAQGDYVASKPAPDPYLLAAERLGVAPSLCLALEDSHNGVRSASSAGMMTVMVPDLLEATDEMRALCAFVADDLHQVRHVILTHGSPRLP